MTSTDNGSGPTTPGQPPDATDREAHQRTVALLMQKPISPQLAEFVLLSSLELDPGNSLEQMLIRVEERLAETGGFTHPGTGLKVLEFRNRGTSIFFKFSSGSTKNFSVAHATTIAQHNIARFLQSEEGMQMLAAIGSSPPMVAKAATA